jgi:isopentenyldiphosphate isomerase
LNRSVKVCAGLGVDRDDVGACARKRLNIFLGLDDHQVHIDRFFRGFAYRFHDQRANRDVGHETSVHDVHVNPIGAGLVDGLDFGRKAAKIS